MTLMLRHGHVVKDKAIITSEDLAPTLGAKTHREFLKKHTVGSRAGQIGMQGHAIDLTPRGTPVNAQVQWGRWVANCECGGQENVSYADPIFMCMSCFNEDNNFAVRDVVFPVDREDVEKELLKRKDTKYQHWLVGETVDDLKAQNADMKALGLPVEET